MGKFDGILICTDLDGTLLNNAFRVSTENFEAIEYFKAEGGRFTFVTGRMYYYAEDVYRMVQPNAPIGCSNGCAVYDFEARRYVWTHELDRSALDLVEAAEQILPEVGFNLNTFEEVFFCRESRAMQFFRDVTGMADKRCHYREVKDPLAKVVFGHDDPAVIDQLEQALLALPLAKKFDFVRSEATLYEILPKSINKGTVLPILAEHLKIDPEKIIAVGDYDNDIGMLRAAHVGIAVANAVPAAKAAADHITVSNEDHAIAKIIADLDEGVLAL